MKKKLFKNLLTSINQVKEIKMKDNYIIGQKAKGGYIRVYDGDYLVGASLTLKEAKEERKRVPDSKIFKLVEVKE